MLLNGNILNKETGYRFVSTSMHRTKIVVEVSSILPTGLIINLKIMDRIRQGFKVLEDAGWSDLINKKWKKDVIKELKTVPDITEEEIQEILDVVLW